MRDVAGSAAALAARCRNLLRWGSFTDGPPSRFTLLNYLVGAREHRRRHVQSERLVCRESSILSGDGGSVMTVSPSRPEARRRFGSETASELGAPVASSIPEQLPGREPASTRKGYEDGNALFRWYRRVEGSFGHHGVARRAMFFGEQ